jgi:hypothetical protein
LTAVAVFLIAMPALALAGPAASVPNVLQVSGALTTAAGSAVSDGAYDIKFALYPGDSGGAPVWTESATVVGVKSAQFQTTLGEKVPLDPKAFGSASLWLGVTVGSDPELPRKPLASVVFALRAALAAGLECSGCIDASQLNGAVLQPYAKFSDLAAVAQSGAYSDLKGLPNLAVYAKAAELAAVAQSGQYADLKGTPDLAPFAKSAELTAVAQSGQYADLKGTPDLTPYAKATDLAAFAKSADLAAIAKSGSWTDLKNIPALAKVGASCGTGLVVSGIAADGTLQCTPGYDASKQLFQFTVAQSAPAACSPQLFGSAYTNDKDQTLNICNGSSWFAMSIAGYGTVTAPGKSCKDILTVAPNSKDGMYSISIGGGTVQVYCDMTSDGGGWTLVTYAYRPVAGGTEVYYLPNSAQGSWDPASRNGKAAINATSLLTGGSQVLLTVTNSGTMPVTGNALSYELAYRWAKQSGYNQFGWALTTTACIDVNVTELKTNTTFSAKTFDNRPEVSCSGHAAGTAYERQFIGFNSLTCYGACGSDPVTSNGMVTWYGDGYTPTTSGGKGDPARAASWGFWIR